MTDTHILYVFAGAMVLIIGACGKIIMNILRASDKARLRDKQIYQQQWSQFLETFNQQMTIAIEQANSNMQMTSALENVRDIIRHWQPMMERIEKLLQEVKKDGHY